MRMHILNGDAAAGSFRQAFPDTRSGELLVFRDVLSCGPLPAFETFEHWTTERERFWHAVLADAPEPRRFADWTRDFYGNWQDLEKADELIVWSGCALSDQLLIAYVAHHMHRLGLDVAKLKVVQMQCLIDSKRVVRGLGELHGVQIQAHPPAFALDDDGLRCCLDTWTAVSDSTPELLRRHLGTKHPSLPIMHYALNALVHRYPDKSNGLSLWDERILSAVREHGPRGPRVIASVLAAETSNSDALGLDAVGDSYLMHRLRRLADPVLSAPLLTVNSMNASIRDTSVSLTEAGTDVLEGRANAVLLNGIDDWVCGVQLESTSDRVWYRSGDALIL